jgi:hypothetical protein
MSVGKDDLLTRPGTQPPGTARARQAERQQRESTERASSQGPIASRPQFARSRSRSAGRAAGNGFAANRAELESNYQFILDQLIGDDDWESVQRGSSARGEDRRGSSPVRRLFASEAPAEFDAAGAPAGPAQAEELWQTYQQRWAEATQALVAQQTEPLRLELARARSKLEQLETDVRDRNNTAGGVQAQQGAANGPALLPLTSLQMVDEMTIRGFQLLSEVAPGAANGMNGEAHLPQPGEGLSVFVYLYPGEQRLEVCQVTSSGRIVVQTGFDSLARIHCTASPRSFDTSLITLSVAANPDVSEIHLQQRTQVTLAGPTEKIDLLMDLIACFGGARPANRSAADAGNGRGVEDGRASGLMLQGEQINNSIAPSPRSISKVPRPSSQSSANGSAAAPHLGTGSPISPHRGTGAAVSGQYRRYSDDQLLQVVDEFTSLPPFFSEQRMRNPSPTGSNNFLKSGGRKGQEKVSRRPSELSEVPQQRSGSQQSARSSTVASAVSSRWSSIFMPKERLTTYNKTTGVLSPRGQSGVAGDVEADGFYGGSTGGGAGGGTFFNPLAESLRPQGNRRNPSTGSVPEPDELAITATDVASILRIDPTPALMRAVRSSSSASSDVTQLPAGSRPSAAGRGQVLNGAGSVPLISPLEISASASPPPPPVTASRTGTTATLSIGGGAVLSKSLAPLPRQQQPQPGLIVAGASTVRNDSGSSAGSGLLPPPAPAPKGLPPPQLSPIPATKGVAVEPSAPKVESSASGAPPPPPSTKAPPPPPPPVKAPAPKALAPPAPSPPPQQAS